MAGMTDSGDGGNDRLIIDAETECGDNAEEVFTLSVISLVL